MKNIKIFLLFLITLNCTNSFIQTNQHPVHTIFVPGFIDPTFMYFAHQSAFPVKSEHSKVDFFDEQPPKNIVDRCIFTICSWFGKHNVNRQSYMGQANDIDAVEQHIQKFSKNLVIFARSKGAAATINALSRNDFDNVKAIILDSCPSDLVQAVNSKIARLGIPSSYSESLWRTAFANYPKNALPPITEIQHIKNKNLPILIITSKTDTTIPFTQALQLYCEFLKHDFKHVHIAIVNAAHCRGIIQDPKQYLTAIHSFYKTYGLPHNTNWSIKSVEQYNYNPEQAKLEITNFNHLVLQQVKKAQFYMCALTTLIASLMIIYQWDKTTTTF